MRTAERLNRLEASLRRNSTDAAQAKAWERLLLALPGALTQGGATYIPAIVALRDRMGRQCLTHADQSVLASLGADDLATIGATSGDVVNVVAEVLTPF